MLSDLPKTWLVIPCYNEASRLDLAVYEQFLGEYATVRFCFVNDGSTDETLAVAQGFAERHSQRVAVLSLVKNAGKAEAVRLGILHVLGLEPADFVGYWDADLATPLEELPRFYAQALEYRDLQLFCGCRLRRLGGDVRRHWVRHILGRVFATLISLLLRLPIYDTQCGAKLFSSSLASKIFAEPFVSSWCFDVEVLERATTVLGRADRMLEVPLRQWQDVGGSKLRLRHFVIAAWDLVRLAWRLRRFQGPRGG
jgi:glycosyltransferase involved in cell wall biosynthesis